MTYYVHAKENQRYLHNSALRDMGLGDLEPEIIGEINDYLYLNNNKLIDAGTFTDINKYASFVNRMIGLCEIEADVEESFRQSFGIQGNPPVFIDESIARDIRKQCINNQPVYKGIDNRLGPNQRELYSQLLFLKKEQEFTQPIDPQKLNDNLVSSKTVGDFMSKFAPVIGVGVSISEDAFFAAKQEYLLNGSPLKTIPIIKEMKNQYETLHKGNKSFKDVVKNADSLINLNPELLKRSVFSSQGTAQAEKMKADFEELNKNCELYLTHLENSKSDLANILSSIPPDEVRTIKDSHGKVLFTLPDTEEIKALKELRKNVSNELVAVESNIEKYSALKEKIERKDPNEAHPGFLQAIDISLHGSQDLEKSAGVNRHVVKRAALEATGPDATRVESNQDLAAKLELDECRVVTLTHGSSDPAGKLFQSKLVEKQGEPREIANNKGGTTKVIPTTWDLSNFPHGPGSKEAQIFVAMNTAKDILANLNTPPDKKHPIQITGERVEELRYLHAALATLGKNDPNFNFTPDAIQVNSASFKPATEYHFINGFKKNSLYETVFKNNPQVKEISAAHNAKTELKFGHENEISKASKDMGHFKDKLHGVKKAVLQSMPDEDKAPVSVSVNKL